MNLTHNGEKEVSVARIAAGCYHCVLLIISVVVMKISCKRMDFSEL